jgi:mannose/fructose/N-acetylgalactosamine-specific phosphotransferase system component IID
MNGKRRDILMVAVIYPIVVALGAMMLADGDVLLGVIQIMLIRLTHTGRKWPNM